LKAPSVPNWCVKFAVSIPHRLAGRWRASLYGIELLELLPFETHRSRRLSKARHFQLLTQFSTRLVWSSNARRDGLTADALGGFGD
jgi:hypothetical protein